ncbi:hypothetical protein H4R26_003809 [Coemansia thaxteri]|uniref:Myb-like domain-containing protein n=1 Tax=Coemansia thaxteri TaxID=2663907 RepID=A0A9W8BC26_9FUNG|nr:hypothetical protein H4R26_003809 [Coemansia thaxteri]
MESMVVDNDGAISSEVAQAVGRYDYAPDGLQTLAATSSAITPHGTPSSRPPNAAGATLSAPHSAYSQKPMMPKFNRSRNWSTEETKILLVELDRISADHPEERRETVLRSHATFEEIAQILRDRGYTNRDGQGCMIRWRNLLRVYKQIRAATAEGNPPSNHPNMQYAPSIESIYRFPPDSLTFMHHEGSPIAEGSPSGGQTRTWAAVNGYETPARKRAREMNMVTEHIDSIDQKIDQTMEYLSQQNEILRSLEERLSRTEDALKSSEAALEILNSTVGEKDTKREELQKQLMVTVQALSQVIAVKKAEQQQQQQ